ncbi:hypothetical protein PPUN109347_27710 [Pseudomonas putida]|nr:hypothetical protein PPUN109347_27710 [Pseudomonas putida]
MLLGVGNARLGSTTAVVIVAQAAIVIAAHTMIARSLAGMITREACAIAIAIVPTHTGAMPTAIAAAVATTTTTATFGVRGTHRRDIGR